MSGYVLLQITIRVMVCLQAQAEGKCYIKYCSVLFENEKEKK